MTFPTCRCGSAVSTPGGACWRCRYGVVAGMAAVAEPRTAVAVPVVVRVAAKPVSRPAPALSPVRRHREPTAAELDALVESRRGTMPPRRAGDE